MYGFPRPPMPNDVQWNRHRAPHSPQWRQFDRTRAPFRPRHQGFNNHRPPMYGGSEEHWCETCDRGFPNEDLLNKHNQQHQKCNIDGCQFIAHPKVITKHIQMQHSSGLYKKIAILNNPEEIEKWREERRKKYPTKTNIDKKAAELKEKIDRGEKMNLGRKGWHSKRDENYQNRGTNSGQGVKRQYNNTNKNQPAAKFRKPRKQTPKIPPAPEENRSLAPFAGIQTLIMDSDEEVNQTLDCDDLIQDDEIGTIGNVLGPIENDKSTKVEKPVVCSALSSLMNEYGSSDEEIDDTETTKQPFKEINKVDETCKSQIKGKEQTYIEDKNAYQISKKVHVDQKLPQQNNIIRVGAESNEVLPMNPGSKVDIIKNNVLDASVKVWKNVSSKPVDLALFNNNKLNPNEKNNANIDQDDNDSGPDEVRVDKNHNPARENNPDNIAQENNADNKILKKKVEVVKRKLVYRKPKPKIPSTLIYKLLSKEMKQERNQVLQCIRYIRKNNYFDKSST